MANEDQLKRLEAALIAADKAGEVEDARVLAAEIVRLRSAQTQDDGFSFGEMVGNVPSSAKKFVGDMANAVVNPTDTLRALGGVIESGLEHLNPFMTEQDMEYKQYGDALVDAVKGRYGSKDAALNTLQTDPVGVLADVSGAVTGVGAAARAPAVAKIGRAIDPINLAINPVKAAAGALPRSLPASMYQSAAKFPPVAVPRKTRDAITETALDYKIMPTSKGIDEISRKLEGLDVKINSLINRADASGKTVSRKAIYSDLKDLRQSLKEGADAPANMRKYTKIVKDLDELMKGGPDQLTPSKLQKFKVATYRDINWRAKPGAKTATMQSLARGARRAIEDVTPEISAVNRQYGPLAELRDRLPQVAHRIDNQNFIPLNTGVLTGAGGAAGNIPGAVAGGLLGMLEFPRVKAGSAIALRELQNAGLLGNFLDNSAMAHAIRHGLLQSGRLEALPFE